MKLKNPICDQYRKLNCENSLKMNLSKKSQNHVGELIQTPNCEEGKKLKIQLMSKL